MIRDNERGMVLVAALLVLALLSLLGAGALTTSSIDTKVLSNQNKSREAFYAAEAALEVGVGDLLMFFKDTLIPLQPKAGVVVPSTADGHPFDGDDFGAPDHKYRVSYEITNPSSTESRTKTPTSYSFTTANMGQQTIHFAYTYRVTATATSLTDGTSDSAIETLRVLETPLVQYYIFFNDDLSWHPGPAMNSWGRIHTNGNLYFANQADTYFRNYDTGGILVPNTITVHDNIVVGSFLQQDGSLATRATNPVYVRVRNLTNVPAGVPSPNPPIGDCENLNISITPTTRSAQEARFDLGGVAHVRTGVDNIPTTSFKNLKRDGYNVVTGSGFYERESLEPQKDNVDGMRISIEGGQLQIMLTLNGQARQEVTQLVHDYQVAPGAPVDIVNWPAAVRTRADNTVATTVGTGATTDMIPGSIVYSIENPVSVMYRGNHTWNFPANLARGAVAYVDNAAAGATNHGGPNPWYPSVLEVSDGREDRQVDFTVVDMQQLQYWYYDYLDYADDNNFNNTVNTNVRSLFIYGTRTTAGTDTPVAGTGNALQAFKLIGSNAGRTRGNGVVPDRQQGQTYRLRTTFATPEPVYFEGDFNINNAAGDIPLQGSAVVCDAPIFLSNNWGSTAATWNRSNNLLHAGTANYPASPTAFATALFSGRYNFRNNPTGGEEAGIHNFTRFIEDWNLPAPAGQQSMTFTGCLINLWFSERATGPHANPNDYYDAPIRIFGWDSGFANWSYWPPYVPSSFSVERQAWQEN